MKLFYYLAEVVCTSDPKTRLLRERVKICQKKHFVINWPIKSGDNLYLNEQKRWFVFEEWLKITSTSGNLGGLANFVTFLYRTKCSCCVSSLKKETFDFLSIMTNGKFWIFVLSLIIDESLARTQRVGSENDVKKSVWFLSFRNQSPNQITLLSDYFSNSQDVTTSDNENDKVLSMKKKIS